jgi:hypothetical protein
MRTFGILQSVMLVGGIEVPAGGGEGRRIALGGLVEVNRMPGGKFFRFSFITTPTCVCLSSAPPTLAPLAFFTSILLCPIDIGDPDVDMPRPGPDGSCVPLSCALAKLAKQSMARTAKH